MKTKFKLHDLLTHPVRTLYVIALLKWRRHARHERWKEDGEDDGDIYHHDNWRAWRRQEPLRDRIAERRKWMLETERDAQLRKFTEENREQLRKLQQLIEADTQRLRQLVRQ